jgi:hypothetical protein
LKKNRLTTIEKCKSQISHGNLLQKLRDIRLRSANSRGNFFFIK